MKAYHFLLDNMQGGYGSEPPWKIGEEREVEGKLRMCGWGYHAGKSWYDALFYARGTMACIVELSGEIYKDTDKYVARKRKLIDARNAERVLRAWACDCAERALKRANVTDTRSWGAIRIARLYNQGEATREELSAARSTAESAAESVARSAAWTAESAARSAESAARSAAWTAESAAGSAAGSAAESAAGVAETKWQKRRLNKLMKELFTANKES